MKHKHHVVPLHMGGTDDPSNIVELTVEEHAEAHRKLFEEHGRWEDELAWKGLAGMITQEELIKTKLSKAGKKGHSKGLGKATKEQRKEWTSKAAKANYAKNKDKIDDVLRANAKKVSELGLGGPPTNKWIWITDGVNNKKVLKSDKIPNNYKRGRTRVW